MAVQNTSLAALLLRIENSLPNLSKSERKVAEYIRGNPRGIIDLSVAALAATRPLVTKLLKKDIKPTNADRVLGGVARVTERIDNDVPTGAVYIDGKTWTARSDNGSVIEPGEMVRILRMEGVKLYVEKEC